MSCWQLIQTRTERREEANHPGGKKTTHFRPSPHLCVYLRCICLFCFYNYFYYIYLKFVWAYVWIQMCQFFYSQHRELSLAENVFTSAIFPLPQNIYDLRIYSFMSQGIMIQIYAVMRYLGIINRLKLVWSCESRYLGHNSLCPSVWLQNSLYRKESGK